MEKMENYLHLYLGCQCMIPMHIGPHELTAIRLDEAIKEKWKPILRPLSDMTEMEAYKGIAMAYQDVYGYSADVQHTKFLVDDLGVGLMVIDRLDGASLGFTVNEKIGVQFSNNGIQLNVDQYKFLIWMLKEGFDLFGLIESGLAINIKDVAEKTTLKD